MCVDGGGGDQCFFDSDACGNVVVDVLTMFFIIWKDVRIGIVCVCVCVCWLGANSM